MVKGQAKRLDIGMRGFTYKASCLAYYLLMKTYDHAPASDINIYGYPEQALELLQHVDYFEIKLPLVFYHPTGRVFYTKKSEIKEIYRIKT